MTALDDLKRPEYPLASKYDPRWLIGLDMGPNPVWLLEDLSRDLDLQSGMRGLDLGSGRGATSVFLAREFGVEVWAADLWVRPEEAAAVFEAAGVRSRVHPVRANAHDLPFGPHEFDVIVSVDAYEYFGTADNYLPYIILSSPGKGACHRHAGSRTRDPRPRCHPRTQRSAWPRHSPSR